MAKERTKAFAKERTKTFKRLHHTIKMTLERANPSYKEKRKGYNVKEMIQGITAKGRCNPGLKSL